MRSRSKPFFQLAVLTGPGHHCPDWACKMEMYGPAIPCCWHWCALAAAPRPAAPTKTRCWGIVWCAVRVRSARRRQRRVARAADRVVAPSHGRGPCLRMCVLALLSQCRACHALQPGARAVKQLCACVSAVSARRSGPSASSRGVDSNC